MSNQDDATQEPEVADEATEDTASDETSEPQEGSTDDLQEIDRKEALSWSPDEAKRKVAKINNEIRAAKKRAEEASRAPKADLAAKDQRITDLETATLRYEIALDLGLPKEIASRLQGKDRDEMVADAEKLLELLSPTKAPATRRPAENLRGGGQPDTEPEEADLSKLGERMFRR